MIILPWLRARNVVMGLLYGLIFMNIGHADNGIPDNIQSHVGAISMILMISMYYIAQSGMLTFQTVPRSFVTAHVSYFIPPLSFNSDNISL